MEIQQTINPRVKQIRSWTIEAPHPGLYDAFGFDPGTTNLGIAYQCGSWADLFQITIERSKDPIERMDDVGFLLWYLCVPNIEKKSRVQVVIEGAGYESSRYRQVELAEVRTTIALWFRTRKAKSILLPAPNTLRKVVFGSGKIKAHEYWDNSEIPNDALTALSCLCYAYQLDKGEITK